MVAISVTGVIFCGAATYLYISKREKLREWEAQCTPMPKDPNYKSTYLQLVKYRGCVLNKDTVTSGTMDKIHDFRVRATDVFVASFPKSGTTWVQEVVYRLHMVKVTSSGNNSMDGSLTELALRFTVVHV